MSAATTEFTTYGWYCAECSDGGEDYVDETDAEIDAFEHNHANHPEEA